MRVLLVAAGLCVGASAWADGTTTVVSINFDDATTGAVADGTVISGTKGSMTISGSKFNITSSETKYTKNTETTQPGAGILEVGNGTGTVVIAEADRAGYAHIAEGNNFDEVTITFSMSFGNCNGQYGGFLIQDKDGNTLASFRNSKWSGIEAATNTFGLESGDITAQSGNLNQWSQKTDFTIIFNYKTGLISCQTNKMETAKTVSMSSEKPVVAKFVVSSNQNTAERLSFFDNLIITNTEGDYTIETYDYTVNWVCDGETVKTATRQGESGESITLTAADKAEFTQDGVKYIYVSDDASTKTVANDGTTVVTITLRKATLYTCTLNAVAGGSIIKEGVEILYSSFEGSNKAYEGITQKMYYPAYVLKDGKYYKATVNAAEPYYGVSVLFDDNKAVPIEYTLDETIDYYIEVENMTESKLTGASFDGFRDNVKNANADRFSGTTPRLYGNHYAYTEALPSGIYSVSLYARNGRSADGENLGANVKVRLADGTLIDTGVAFPSWNSGQTDTKTVTNVIVPDGASVVIAAGSNNTNIYMDYLYMVRTGDAIVSGTIASSGYSSLASSYGLDFSTATGLTAAYVVTATTNDAVTLTSVDELPANSGVILKGNADAAYSIPVKADAAYDGENLLSAAVSATPIEANTAYILQGGLFHLVTAASTVPAGKAYLLKSNVPSAARSMGFAFVDNEASGINSVSSDRQNGEFYNLQGQRVDTHKKGLYIVNGVKVIIK